MGGIVVQDLEGKMIKTAAGTQYLLTEKIGEGAQGVVYDEAMDKFLIKPGEKLPGFLCYE